MFGIASFIVGIGISIWVGRNLYYSIVSTSWPTTQGRIIASEVKVKTRVGKENIYRPMVVYEFSSGGTRFEGNRISFSPYFRPSSAEAKEIVARYPRGADVQIYYNKRNPEASVLELGILPSAWLALGLGMVFFALGLYLTIRGVLGKPVSGIEIR